MKAKDILSWLALLLGAVLIIDIFFIFMKDMPNDSFALNLSVSLLVYALFFVDILIPWVDWRDKSKSRIGSIGLRWVATWIYAILAITAVMCNKIYNIEFSVQLILHGILLLILTLGISGALHASDKVVTVHNKETVVQMGITEMRRAFSELKQAVYKSSDISQEIQKRIEYIEEELTYISPCNNPEAATLEKQFLEIMHDVCHNINKCSNSSDRFISSLEKASHILKSRKSIYSL